MPRDERKTSQPRSGSTIVSHYGVHWAPDGLAFYHAGRGGGNAFGRAVVSPFDVRLRSGRVHCNHQIQLTAPVVSEFSWAYFLEIATDPVVQAMLPLPKAKGEGGLYWIEDGDGRFNALLAMLAQMTSPIYPVVQPGYKFQLKDLSDLLFETNVQPLVYTQLPLEKARLLHAVAQVGESAPRRLVVTGDFETPVPAAFKKIEFSETVLNRDFIELLQLPWSALGGTVLRKYMRGEWPPKILPGGVGFEFVPPGTLIPNK